MIRELLVAREQSGAWHYLKNYRVISVVWLLLASLAALLVAGPAIADATERDQTLDLEVVRSRGTIFNPWTGANDPVELRSFRGGGTRDGDFVAPTIRIAPGKRLTINLANRLAPCTDEQTKAGRCYNATNLHTHGLWVSPSGNSDNVLITVPPGGQFRYDYDIPADHPAGTFWYHPHQHGNTFVQVGSGMGGALIVTGNRNPTPDRPGDVDILLKDSRGQPFAERIMMLQQIQYGCLDEKGQIEGRLVDGAYVRPWTCAAGRIGTIESKDNDRNWNNSGRFTGINGKVQPQLAVAKVGGFERWRLVHAGTRERIRLHVRLLDPAAPDLRTVPAADQEHWIKRYCSGPSLPLWHIAFDGLTRSAVFRTDEAVLFPGDRLDTLVNYPVAGRYCVIHESSRSLTNPQPPRVIAMIRAEGTKPSDDPAIVLQQTLIKAAQWALAGPANQAIREKVVADLGNGLRLGAFAWHKPVPKEEVSGYREALLNIIEPPEANQVLFHVNGKTYDHDRIDYLLPLGATEEWHVRSLVAGHPLHIHVNPFQIIGVFDGRGRDVTDPAGPAYDPDYAGLINEWKDTVFVRQGYKVVFARATSALPAIL